MSLKNRINEDIKQAMRSKDQAALRALRAIKAAILLAETAEGSGDGPISEAEEMKILTKQVKQRRDSAAQFSANGREDLAVKENEELVIIEKFLPAALSPEEMASEVKAIIAKTGAESMKDMGKVMGIATQKLAGRADGKAISALVRQLLA